MFVEQLRIDRSVGQCLLQRPLIGCAIEGAPACVVDPQGHFDRNVVPMLSSRIFEQRCDEEPDPTKEYEEAERAP